MRLSVGSIAASIIMAAVLISYWPGSPMQLNQSLAQAQQGEKATQTASFEQEKIDVNTQTQTKLEKPITAEFVETPLEQLFGLL